MILQVKSLSFSYEKHEVLSDISFNVYENEFLSVLGSNGVGKTTLFRCLLSILKSYKGEINYRDREIRTIEHKKLAEIIAYIPQIHRPSFGYTVLDTVLMGTSHRFSVFSSPKSEHVEEAYQSLKRMGVEYLAHRNYAEISGGEQQLVLISRALAQGSKILVMDEPTSHLDYGNQYHVLQQVRLLADQGYTIILSTHNPQHALIFSDRILALHKGKVRACGQTSELLDQHLIRDLYNIETSFEQTKSGCVIIPI